MLLVRILRIVGLAANVLSLGLHSLACFQFGQAEERDRFEEADTWLNMVEEWLDGEADILRVKLKQSRNVVLIFSKTRTFTSPYRFSLSKLQYTLLLNKSLNNSNWKPFLKRL